LISSQFSFHYIVQWFRKLNKLSLKMTRYCATTCELAYTRYGTMDDVQSFVETG